MAAPGSRTVVANICLSLDGRVTGPGGEYDMSWTVRHAVTDAARDHLATVIGTATTALIGRRNYQSFASFWPAVAEDDEADARDRAFARWLNAVEKIVFSTTLRRADWDNSRLTAAAPAAVIRALRSCAGGDILVLASASIIRSLLEAGELDRLSIILCPELVGGCGRLFGDGPAGSSWRLTSMSVTESGAACLLYDRIRPGMSDEFSAGPASYPVASPDRVRSTTR
jgi:dihydrofolate reductase